MSAMWLFLSGVAAAGAVLGWWLHRRATRRVPSCPVPTLQGEGADALPAGNEEDGLAAFYAYQLAASRIERA